MYRERRDAMVDALHDLMPAACRWNVPDGGFYVWLTLPPGIDAKAMLPRAVTARVAYVPGTAFFADGFGSSAMRLSFCYPTPERIREGVRRLAGVIEAELELRATFDAYAPARELGPAGLRRPQQRPLVSQVPRRVRDLTYPPIIVAAKTGFRVLGQKIRITGADHVPAQRRRPARRSTTSATSTSSTAAWPRTRRVARSGSWPSASCSTTGWTGPLMRSMHHIEVDRADGEASLRTARRLPRGRRGGRHLPRGHHLPGHGAQGVQDRRGADRGRGRRARWCR